MFRWRRERSPRPEVLRETGRCASERARCGRHAVLQAITCSEEAADALPSWRRQSDPGLPLIVASSLEYVSSDWVAVEVSAVAVVLSECTCGREIAAYHRSAVSSFGEHGCVAWICHAEGGGRGDHGVIASRVSLATRTCRLLAAFCQHSCGAVIARTASGSSRVAPWPAATEALMSS